MATSLVRSILVATLLALVGASADASVLCRSVKKGTVAVRTACTSKEVPVDVVALGLVGPKGDKGDKGDTGAQGPGARWIRVLTDGTVAAQSGGISVTKDIAGFYLVDFGSSQSGKHLSISLGCFDNDECPPAGTPAVALCGGGAGAASCPTGFNDTSTVLVVMVGPDNQSFADAPFLLAAF